MSFLVVALFFYGLSAAAFLACLLSTRDVFRKAGPVLFSTAAGFHVLSVAVRSVQLGHVAVTPVSEGISFLACALAVIFLALHWRYRLTVVGTVVAPAVFFLALGAALGMSGQTELPPSLRSAWLPVHVTLAFLGHAVLAVAFAASLVYLFEERRIKRKRPPRRRQIFPSLEKLDVLNHRLLVWGFPLLTLGIVTGAIWAHVAWGDFWSWEARETWSLVTWVLYAILVHGRVSAGWRGRLAASLTIVGFGFVVVSFLSVNLLFPGRHGGTFGS